MRSLLIASLSVVGLGLACGGQEEASSPEAAPPPGVPGSGIVGPPPGGQPPLGGGLRGSSPVEDLSSSWSGGLAVPVGDGVPAPACQEGELPIPAGAFLMGSQSDHAGRDEQPVHVVQLAGFCLDRTEVSVGEFAGWIRGADRTAQGPDLRSMSPEGDVEAGREGHPAEGVTWSEAAAFCADAGKSLPTEAQWEKAARGGCEGGDDPEACDAGDLRPYPWGVDGPSCERANHQYTGGGFPKMCTSDTQEADSGAGGAGPYGHVHLSGNVWEYVADAWHPAVYGSGEMRTDPTGPLAGENHVLRGGGWNTFSTNMRSANRFNDLVMGSAAGFRCARSSVTGTPDDVEPLTLVSLTGTVSRSQGSVSGRALYITVFDQADADARTGMLAPGRSPVAEARLVPNGGEAEPFEIRVPSGGTYILSAALDDGSGADKDDYISASGSGGFGPADQNPIRADTAVSGLTIRLLAAPVGGAILNGPPPGGMPPGGVPPGGVPGSGPVGPPLHGGGR